MSFPISVVVYLLSTVKLCTHTHRFSEMERAGIKRAGIWKATMGKNATEEDRVRVSGIKKEKGRKNERARNIKKKLFSSFVTWLDACHKQMHSRKGKKLLEPTFQKYPFIFCVTNIPLREYILER